MDIAPITNKESLAYAPELQYPVLCYMPYTGTHLYQTIYRAYQILPSTRIIIACTVTVQLPMRVLHGVRYSSTTGSDDQSLNEVCYSQALGSPLLTF